jgi:hypothetical protein|nr:MAG TPA: hypothetical protein [Caudoviricetes sp.]
MQNEIINKIAEWLQISVEKAVELYPQLRMETVWYSVMNNVSTILLCSGVVIIIFMFVDYMNYTMCSYKDEVEIKKSASERLKQFAKFLMVLVALLLVLSIVSPFLYPNIVFFKQFVK